MPESILRHDTDRCGLHARLLLHDLLHGRDRQIDANTDTFGSSPCWRRRERGKATALKQVVKFPFSYPLAASRIGSGTENCDGVPQDTCVTKPLQYSHALVVGLVSTTPLSILSERLLGKDIRQ